MDHAQHLLQGLDTLIVQDLVMTKTAEMADVVFPASHASFESDGTVTNSERRVQRVRKALDPPGDARDDIWIIGQLANRLGVPWGDPTPEELWDEMRSLSPMHTLMSWERIEELGGIQWPCNEEYPDGALFLHERLWRFDDPERQGRKAPLSVVIDAPPKDELSDEFPMRLTTGRRLESYNTGVQSGSFDSPLHRGETLDLSPEDADALGVDVGERVRIVSRRGAIEAPVHVTTALRPGLAFMTFHFPDEVETNRITNEAYDPKSGTSEFKATAIRVEKLSAAVTG
jgi:formate dehydrogenase major subunit